MAAPESSRIRIPRWVTMLLALAAVGLPPWTLWLTFTLPSRHVTEHYDVAWVVFDCALFCAFAATAWAALKGSEWLVPFAAVTGTMLVCDAWFDVLTSHGTTNVAIAAVLAIAAELPLAAFCFWIAWSVQRVVEDALPHLP
jgi:hypothetical protein